MLSKPSWFASLICLCDIHSVNMNIDWYHKLLIPLEHIKLWVSAGKGCDRPMNHCKVDGLARGFSLIDKERFVMSMREA